MGESYNPYGNIREELKFLPVAGSDNYYFVVHPVNTVYARYNAKMLGVMGDYG